MTADLPARLTETLAAHQPVSRWVNYRWEGFGCSCGVMAEDFRQHLVAALLPLFDTHAQQVVARALDECAEELAATPGNPYPLVINEYLRERAAWFRAAPATEVRKAAG